MLLDESRDAGVNPPLECVRGTPPEHLLGVDRSKRCNARVAQHHLERLDVIDGHAVHDRATTGGVVADHAADGCAVAGGRIGTENQAVLARGAIEVVLHNARLDAGETLLGIQIDDGVHVTRGVDDHRATHRLTREAGARASGQHGHTPARADPDGGGNISGIARKDHRNRFDAVHAGVAREQMTRVRIGAHLPAHHGAELRLEAGYRRRLQRAEFNQRRPHHEALRSPSPSIRARRGHHRCAHRELVADGARLPCIGTA